MVDVFIGRFILVARPLNNPSIISEPCMDFVARLFCCLGLNRQGAKVWSFTQGDGHGIPCWCILKRDHFINAIVLILVTHEGPLPSIALHDAHISVVNGLQGTPHRLNILDGHEGVEYDMWDLQVLSEEYCDLSNLVQCMRALSHPEGATIA